MKEITKEDILQAIGAVTLGKPEKSLMQNCHVETVKIDQGRITFIITIESGISNLKEEALKKCEDKVKEIPGVISVSGIINIHEPLKNNFIKGIKSTIVVASGKGGVGKSTVAVNLAAAMAHCGYKTGILDADIYGPSIPKMFGTNEKPKSKDGKIIEPILKYNIKCMSIGFLIGENTPVIWRGPMVMKYLMEMINSVNWGNLDILVVDMPPGTGDVQLTMAQKFSVTGSVIVSTPQDIALIDVKKGIEMFKKTNIPNLGIIENMSYFIAPDTGKRYEIFGSGGAKQIAKKLGCDFLTDIPIDIDLRELSDKGTPIVFEKPQSPQTTVFINLAKKIMSKIAK